ncbi:MAG: glycoside hydrolase family 16 protein [Balneolaceae bacterium]|nr:glycoside hydrolase family 16 protein [Balneolaceae bacterium]MCH8547523.1 glycoside hydrolase family 16 protein [Balneolaceae bacterium]
MKFLFTLMIFCGTLLANSTYSYCQNSWELVWSEEFDGDELNTEIWNYWYGPAYNNELQFYTGREENIFLKNDKLHIRALDDGYRGYDYTSARISTDSTRIGWKEGRFEARIKMPEGNGFWPAFWLMPIRDDGWPKGGEIDIMEYRGNETRTTTGALHYWIEDCDGNPVECREYQTSSHTVDGKPLSEEFNIYALEWEGDKLTWYLNDHQFMQVSLSDLETEFEPFSTPFYIILNLAVGGDFLPNPDETTPFPSDLVVDYVRVYQRP